AGPAHALDHPPNRKLNDGKDRAPSLLWRKPLNLEEHGGGKKFQEGDQGYKAFRTFIEDYAKIATDGYKDAAQLPRPGPQPLQFGTERWIKLSNTPPEWGDKYLAVTVYAWDDRAKSWEKEPVATTDRMVWGKGKLWQHTLTLLAAKGSERAERWKKDANPTLPKGRYLVKVYVDQKGRLQDDWKATLGPDEYVGQVEVQSEWKAGYGAMTEIDAPRVKK